MTGNIYIICKSCWISRGKLLVLPFGNFGPTRIFVSGRWPWAKLTADDWNVRSTAPESASNSLSDQFGLRLAITICTWSMAMFSSFLADDVFIYIGSIHCAWFSEVKVALPRYFSLTKIVSVIVKSVAVFCRRTDPKFTINLTTRFVKLS